MNPSHRYLCYDFMGAENGKLASKYKFRSRHQIS